MEKFRSHEINILIGTNVIEEGIDIPLCNMIFKLYGEIFHFSRCKNFS
jgi:ERCC4-related helicase